MIRRLLLVAVCAACTHPVVPPPPPAPAPAPAASPPPTIRATAELPVIASAGDEYAIFERARAAYVAAGFAEAAAVTLDLDDRVMIPFTSTRGPTVVMRHFTDDGPGVREHLAAVSHFLYGDRLPAAGAIAFADYRAFMTALACHELGHALAIARDRYDATHPWREESRAIDLELGCLGDLVRAGAVPADTIAAYDRFDRVLLAAAPAGQPADLDPVAFDAAYAKLGRVLGGGDPKQPVSEPAAADVVLAMYSRYRIARAAEPAPPLATLTGRLP